MELKLKWTAALLSLGLCTAGMTLPAAALTEDSSHNAYLCDEADSLLDDEFEKAMTEIQETADYTGMNVAVYIGGIPLGYGESSTITFCDDHYDDMFGINTDGVFLYIDMSGEDDLFDYLSTSGLGQFYYTNASNNNRVDEIIQDVERYLPRGAENVYDAIDEFCFDLRYYYDKGIPDKYYTYNSDNNEYLYYENGELKYDDHLPTDYTASASWGTIIIISALIGLAIGLASLWGICHTYRFKKAGNTRNYLEHGGIRMTRQTDQFLRQYRTRTRISSDSSSGGGGGGGGGSSHSSSSGGSHGGGGGHR